jgi:hypothetical protein
LSRGGCGVPPPFRHPGRPGKDNQSDAGPAGRFELRERAIAIDRDAPGAKAEQCCERHRRDIDDRAQAGGRSALRLQTPPPAQTALPVRVKPVHFQ